MPEEKIYFSICFYKKNLLVVRTFVRKYGYNKELVFKLLNVFLLQLWINRITAASQEHGLKYPAFIINLVKCQVELNRKVLADLAIYEPKTFKSLAALALGRKIRAHVSVGNAFPRNMGRLDAAKCPMV